MEWFSTICPVREPLKRSEVRVTSNGRLPRVAWVTSIEIQLTSLRRRTLGANGVRDIRTGAAYPRRTFQEEIFTGWGNFVSCKFIICLNICTGNCAWLHSRPNDRQAFKFLQVRTLRSGSISIQRHTASSPPPTERNSGPLVRAATDP